MGGGGGQREIGKTLVILLHIPRYITKELMVYVYAKTYTQMFTAASLAREFQKNICFCLIDYTKDFVWIITNCGTF